MYHGRLNIVLIDDLLPRDSERRTVPGITEVGFYLTWILLSLGLRSVSPGLTGCSTEVLSEGSGRAGSWERSLRSSWGLEIWDSERSMLDTKANCDSLSWDLVTSISNIFPPFYRIFFKLLVYSDGSQRCIGWSGSFFTAYSMMQWVAVYIV